MEVVSKLEEVSCFETRSGHARFVARDAEGREFTTFHEQIGERAKALQGRQVRIRYHEVQRGRYNNVYLDEIEEIPGTEGTGPSQGAETVSDVEEAAWRTAVEAAPWLVGQPDGTVEPEELYEKLKPFEQRIADDIAAGRGSDAGASDDAED
jgi:hypothetical protein